MFLIDEQESRIQASVNPGVVSRFKTKLAEGRVITIRNFGVGPNSPLQNQKAKINHPVTIIVKHGTLIDEYQEGTKIDEHGFQFVPFRDIGPCNAEFTIDVLGVVDVYKPVEYVATLNGAPKCELVLRDAEGRVLVCVLWGDYLAQWQRYVDHHGLTVGAPISVNNNPVVVAAQFFMKKTFRGNDFVQTMTKSSKFYINPDVQEVKDFIKSRVLGGSSTPPSMTVGIVNLDEWLQKPKPDVFIIKAQITEVVGDKNWYYYGCSNIGCSKKIVGKVPGDVCIFCNTVIAEIIPRYQIIVKAVDEADNVIQLKLFDESASYFVHKSVLQVLNEMEQSDQATGIPECFDNLLFKECLFKVEVKEVYNIGLVDSVYTVKRVNGDSELMAKFASMMAVEEVASVLQFDEGCQDSLHVDVPSAQTATKSLLNVGNGIAENSGASTSLTPAKVDPQTIDITDDETVSGMPSSITPQKRPLESIEESDHPVTKTSAR